MTASDKRTFNNDVQSKYEKLCAKQEDGDIELAGLGGDDLMYRAVEEAEAAYDDAMDSRMEEMKEREWD